MTTIISTSYKNPQAVISNGQTTGVEWTNPNDILTINEELAQSAPSGASDIIVGNFPFGVPQDAIITGIAFKIRAKQGATVSPPNTLTIYAVDNTSGEDVFYPYDTPFDGLSTDLEYYDFGGINYLFNQTFTPDQVNNLKFQFIANSNIFMDSVMVKIFYYVPSSTDPIDPGDGCENCDSPIQALPFKLALPFKATDTKAYFQSFTYPNGEPIQPEDLGDCGGFVDFVFDSGIAKGNGNNFMENARCPATWTFLSNGTVEIDFVTLDNRGLDFKTGYGSVADNISDHNPGTEVIISNSGPFYQRFLRRCEIGITVSAPIDVFDESAEVVTSVEKLDFVGAGVIVSQDITDPKKAIITIPGAGSTTPPVIVGVGSYSSGGDAVTNGSYFVPVSGINRGVKIDVNAGAAVSGITVGGVAATLITAQTISGVRQEQWFLIAPALGTLEVVVTLVGPAILTSGAIAVVGADQTDPIGNSAQDDGTGTAASIGITTTLDNSLILGTVATDDSPLIFTIDAGNAETYQRSLVTDLIQEAGGYQPSGTSPDAITMGWTISKSTTWSTSALEILGITSGGSGDQSGITWEDEGTPLGTNGTVTEVDFVGSGVSATRAGNKVTVTIPGGGGGTGTALEVTISQTAHGLSVGDVIKSSGVGDEYDLAIADNAVNAEVVGIVTAVVNANSFKYSKDIMNYTGAGIPAGTPGEAVFLSPTTPGAMTMTEPTVAGQISKPVGILTDSGAQMNFTADYRGQDVQATIIGNGGLLHSFSNTTPTVPPTTTPVVVDTYAIPGNTFAIGDVIRLVLGITISVNSSNSGGSQVNLVGNPISIITGPANGTVGEHVVTLVGVVKASTIEFSLQTLSARGGVYAVGEIGAAIAIAFNKAVSQTFDFVAFNGTSNGGTSVAFNSITVEKV